MIHESVKRTDGGEKYSRMERACIAKVEEVLRTPLVFLNSIN
jgi:hypothetical protein